MPFLEDVRRHIKAVTHLARDAEAPDVDNDRWAGSFDLTENTRYRYTIAAWASTFESWRQELHKKRGAQPDLSSELSEGEGLVLAASRRADAEGKARLNDLLIRWQKAGSQHDRVEIALDESTAALVRRYEAPFALNVYDRELEVVVDRLRGRYGAWYEMFPRSQGTLPGRGATFKDCERRLPAIRGHGFRRAFTCRRIHPIGRFQPQRAKQHPDARPERPRLTLGHWQRKRRSQVD